MTPDRPESADLLLAEGFAQQVQSWALAQGAPEDIARAARIAARAVSVATANGHVCIALQQICGSDGGPGDAAAWRQALLASGVVGTAQAPAACPLILDLDDRLYLHRYFDYERRLAQRLMRAQRGADSAHRHDEAAANDVLRRHLDALFPASELQPAGEVDWQRIATALALRGRLAIVSGGPGTGKTTTVVNLLACLIAQDADCRIALAAPTGKAAARMTDAIRQRAEHLPEAIRSRLPAEAFTIHRLLGVTPAAGGFVHHAGNPLAIDALVVDEASMLDLALATKLLEAVPASARIVLLGDKDQLAAVESGAVFAELSADPSLSTDCRGDLAALCGVPPGAHRAARARRGERAARRGGLAQAQLPLCGRLGHRPPRRVHQWRQRRRHAGVAARGVRPRRELDRRRCRREFRSRIRGGRNARDGGLRTVPRQRARQQR